MAGGLGTPALGCSALESALLSIPSLFQKFHVLHKHAVPAPFLAWVTQDRENPGSGDLLDATQCAGIRTGPMDWDSWLPDWHLPCARTYVEAVETNDMQSLPSQALLSSRTDT